MMIQYFRHKFGSEGEFLCYTLPAVNRSLQALGRVSGHPKTGASSSWAKKGSWKNGYGMPLLAWMQEEMIVCDD